ncbi:MAG: hypothetical protein IPP29_05365 [Bacteroidetes bacterium]|nr:hypothetical protein [Bacteroidota bacterium]
MRPWPKENYWITAAAFNAMRDKLVLLSSAQIRLFQNFTGTDYFGGNVSNLQLSGFTQKEGITFDNGLQLYICDEQTFGFFGNIYKTDLNTVLANVEPSHNELSNINFYVDGDYLVVQNLPNYFATISLVNALGETVISKENCEEYYSFVLNACAKGCYILKISDLNQQRSFLKYLLSDLIYKKSTSIYQPSYLAINLKRKYFLYPKKLYLRSQKKAGVL